MGDNKFLDGFVVGDCFFRDKDALVCVGFNKFADCSDVAGAAGRSWNTGDVTFTDYAGVFVMSWLL